MKKNEVTEKEAIHCKTKSEFDRIMGLFELDIEYMDWFFYKEDTVLFPFENAYGNINGYCQEIKANVVMSTEITPA